MARHNVTVEDSSPTVVYRDSSQWTDSPPSDPDYSEYSGPSQSFNSFHITNVSASVDFPFNGSAIYVFGSIGPTHGEFTVTLTPNDTAQATGSFLLGGPPVESTNATGFHAGGNSFQMLLYSRTGLDQSVPHSITITNSGQGQFILDYFIVESEVGQPDSSVKEFTVDDAHPAFTYPVGSWDTDLSSLKKTTSGQNFLQLLNNQTEHDTQDVGAQFSLTFRGSGVALHSTWFEGSFFARVDNRASVSVKKPLNGTAGLYNRPRELIFSADGLDEGMHTVTVTNSEATFLTIDYAVVSTTDPKNLDGVTPPSGDNSANNGTQGSGDPGAKSTTNLGPIIGGVVGGIVLVVLIAVALWLWRCRRQRRVRERVDLMQETDTASVLRANSWVPWRPASPSAGGSESHLAATAAMSSISGPASDLSHESTSALAPSHSASSAPHSVDPAAATSSSESHSGPAPAVVPINTPSSSAPGPRSGKRRRVPEPAPEPATWHEADAGVTLLRAGTVTSTLPPLYDARWDHNRGTHA